jgi:hypothetical protein
MSLDNLAASKNSIHLQTWFVSEYVYGNGYNA